MTADPLPDRSKARPILRSHVAAMSVIAGITAMVSAPAARAEDHVTYEIFSNAIPVLSGVEYRDATGKKLLQGVALPWRITVPVADAQSPRGDGAELRADWRPDKRRYDYVTVRISLNGAVLCENTLDVGNATCYGSVPHRTSPPAMAMAQLDARTIG